MKIKRILLIFPDTSFCWSAPPPGIGYIASALEGIGFKVNLIDCQITPRYKKIILSLLSGYPVVGISVNAGNISSALDLAQAIKKTSPKTKIIMGGPHASVVYERLIPEYADIVVRGEGEDTIVELMQQKDLSNIKGIAYWDNGLKVNPLRPYIDDLDRLRLPSWHLYNLKKYRFSSCRIPMALVITSRGCPYDCIYCTKFIHGYKVRVRSINNVLGEVDYLISNFGTREIHFDDDNVTSYPQRFKELCKAIISRRYENVRFSLLADPNFGDYEIFKLMKQANFYSVNIAVESASPEVLRKVGRKFNLKELKERIEMAKREGLRVNAHFILGLPSDTIDTMKQTINFAKSLSVTDPCFSIAIPFPGTKLYKMVEEKGKFLYDMSLTSISYDWKPVYEMYPLKAKDVEIMFKQACRDFYFKLDQILMTGIEFLKLKSPKMILNLIKRRLN